MEEVISRENKERFFTLYWGQKVLNRPYREKDGLEPYGIFSGFSLVLDESYLELTPLHLISDEDATEVLKIFGKYHEKSSRPLKFRTKKSSIDRHLFRQVYQDGFDENDGYLSNEVIKANFSLEGWHAIHAHMSMDWKGLDFLRSKGYAVPFMGITVARMIEAGWIKLKE